MNNASDGDILVAWALTEAAEQWKDLSYRIAARRIAVEVGRKVVINKTKYGPLLLPAVSGFASEDRTDGPVVNLSYWVFPAFSRLPLVAPGGVLVAAAPARLGEDLERHDRPAPAHVADASVARHGRRNEQPAVPILGTQIYWHTLR